MAGEKHLIQCHCVLPQYRNMVDPLFHKFVVFSKVNNDGSIIQKLCKCNNCGVIHKIVDFCKSEISGGKDSSEGIFSIRDVRSGMDEKLCEILDSHDCDLATWEQIDDILENQEWNSKVVISKQSLDDSTQVKLLVVRSSDKFKIEAELRQDDIG